MRKLAQALLLAGLLGALVAVPAPAAAAGECEPVPPVFGICDLDLTFTPQVGAPSLLQAGSHPLQMTTAIGVKTREEGGVNRPVEEVKDIKTFLPTGLVGDPNAAPRCSTIDFLAGETPECPDDTVLGLIRARVLDAEGSPGNPTETIYNLEPVPGSVARIGFIVSGVAPGVIDLGLNPNPPYNVVATAANIAQLLPVVGAEVQIAGIVGDKPLLTLPTRCDAPLETNAEADSWLNPGVWVQVATAFTHDENEPPAPLAPTDCDALDFSPEITAQPTSRAASSPSGLDFSLDVDDPGLVSPTVTAASQIRKAEVTLPPGMTANPSLAEGLAVCTEAQLEAETAFSAPGEGCPQASKIGTVEVETPLLDENVNGALYVAKPYENLSGDALIALYVVIKNANLGIIVKQALKVTPDPVTGQLITTTAEDIPQLPFSHFRLRFREGARSPLISPPGCGTFQVSAKLTPWSGDQPLPTTAPFEIISGPNGSPCPQGNAPFKPGFEAGTNNNAAGRYSPFYMRLTRGDGEQDMTRFSSILPPGVVGKIAGVPYCPEAGIAQAISRSGPHGAQEELEDPSCPAASKIGRTVAGAGVGSQLTYVPGSLYLAGPYHGPPLSVVSITPALAGPFDAGTVVVREALTLNPITAEVEVDGSASDPIPHILKGIPLNVRDLRVYVDRPEFTLNATSCEEAKVRATLWGGGTALLPLSDSPVGLAARYQAADCASLGFKPRLAIKLKGGTKRGGHPALKAVVTPRPNDANFARAVVTLPRSAFLDQGHIRTICTRVQFAAGEGNGTECPQGAQYGYARAWSPLLEEPLQGPVFLRSSDNNLPDLVVALHGLVDIDLSARIDSRRGGIRTTFAAIPDAPVSRFILEMQGGRKGLIVNSTDLCRGKNRARANLAGQNGRRRSFQPVVRAVSCGRQGR